MRQLIQTTVVGSGQGFSLVEAKQFKTLSEHAVQIRVLPGSTAVTVELDGSLDGADWFQIAQHVLSAPELAAGAAMFFTNLSPVEHVRANVTINTDGTTVTVFHTANSN